ncbi:MAG: MlaD family protein [Bacteroidota bacterium]
MKVGILAVVSGVLLYVGFNFLKGSDLLSGTSKYYVKYRNVDGLTVSNPVVEDGLTVGRVSGIKQFQLDGYILVELDIREDYIVGDTTEAILVNSDFLGGKAIQLKGGNLYKPLLPGDTLASSIDDPLSKVLETTGDVASDIGVTITRINEILAGMKGSGEDLAEMIRRTNDFISSTKRELNTSTYRLNETMADAQVAIRGLSETIEKVNPILDNTNDFVGDLKELDLQQTLDKTNSLLSNLDETITSFKNQDGTIGKLVNNDSVYNNLNQLLIDLDKLTNHLNEHPKDFFSPLGKKSKKVKKNLN